MRALLRQRCLRYLLLPTLSRADDSKTVAPGAKWEVPATTTLSDLTIGEGAKLSAPAGHTLTMTVDGVEVDIRPGAYHGKIVLTVADPIDLKLGAANGMGSGGSNFRAALFVDDGKVVKESSVLADIVGGHVNDTTASGISITSNGDLFNGVLITGDSKYTINNPTITMTGVGSDMDGTGSAVMTAGKADLTLNHAKIVTRGVYRSALLVRGNSTVHINDSDVEAYTGVDSHGPGRP